jgi:hypothetical protein
MSDFPESEIEILDDYVSDEFIAGMRAGLSAAIISFDGEIVEPDDGSIERIVESRKKLSAFLASPVFQNSLGTLHDISEQMSTRDFSRAEDSLKTLPDLPSFSSVPDFGNALHSTPVRFVELIQSLPNKPKIRKNRTLPGYAGPSPDDTPGKRLSAWHRFLSNGPEHAFRVNLLRAEINAALNRFGVAIDLYKNELIANTPAGAPLHKFLIIRCASASLALGDSFFRNSTNPDEATRKQSRDAFVAAVNLVQTGGISPDNPRRQQIERYATVQIGKLDAGLNFIGYRDSYVPIIKPDVLKDLAKERIAQAQAAIDKFELFKSKADQVMGQLKDLDFDQEIKGINNTIALNQIAKANQQQQIADERLELINTQLAETDIPTPGTVASLGSFLLQGAAAGFLAGGSPGIGLEAGTNMMGVAGALGGFATTLAGNDARANELKIQKRIAETEKSIAARDVEIAILEQQIVKDTVEFLGDKIRRIQSGELNPDLYYAAAETFRTLAEHHLDAAIKQAHLFRQAVAFLRLKPDLPVIKFNYFEGELGSLLTAPSKLTADLEAVILENQPSTKFQFLAESYSLRFLFPVEFSRFLQTGSMEFTLSLFELNKRRPGVSQQRIKRVDIQVIGLVPITTGFTGRIIHHGSFLLRDKDSTPEPGAGSFIPTDQQLADAFAKLNNGATQGVPIAGIIPFLLDEDILELSPDPLSPDLGDPDPQAVRLLEGYGPAGGWRLEIENIDLRLITDVILKLTCVQPESDADLSRRVKGLIAAYEQELSSEDHLDLITPFSLRQQFPDTFSQLVGGQASLSLRREDFPPKITDLNLKTVVAQALDQQKKGIEGLALAIARPGTTLDLTRSTHADGFSEDVTAEIPFLPSAERFPVEGSYTLSLPDPGQASRLDDLILFFVYDFQEI